MRVNVVRPTSSTSPTGIPILFVHGIGSTSATWSAVMDLMKDKHPVACFDLMGHGGSPTPEDPAEFTRDSALEDIDEILATFDQPALLVGHSLGGYLTLAHGATRPDATSGLVVLNTGPGFRDAEKREGWNAMSRRNAHRFGVEPQVAELNLQADSVVMERLAEMTVPTLFLAGSADRPDYTNSGQYMARKMPNCTFVAIEDGEHAMHEESHAAEVANLIGDFAAGVSE